MASREKVGNSVSEFLQDMSEYELTCPICFEEFKEPKSLPNCAHSVCLQCLEKMSERSTDIFECPVCRVESPLPTDGVKAWPTNTRIVRLMDRFPGRQDKLALKNAVERCKAACEASSQREEQHKLMSDRVKREVEEKAQRLVEFIREQEHSLLDMIEEVLMSECLESGPELRDQALVLTNKADAIIERGDVYEIVDAKETLVSQMDQISKDLQPRRMSNFSDILRETIQGDKQLSTDISHNAKAASNNNLNQFDPKYNRSISKTKEQGRFYPFDLAISSSNNIVVLDSRFQNICIFDEGGRLSSQFKISFDDLWGMMVTNDDKIIVVSNDSTDDAEICGYLTCYDFVGNVISRKTNEEFKNTFLTGITQGDTGNFIITSGVFPNNHGQLTKGGITVLNQNLEVVFSSLGGEKPLNMRKAVLYHDKYYCTELIKPGKDGCIKVFDKHIKLLEEFGHNELRDPHGLVVDCNSSRILVCDRQLNAIMVFNMDGSYLTRFNTKSDPVQITISPTNRDIIVACYLGSCVHVISYKWFLEVTDKSVQALKWIS